jgi:hypothetical protein
MMHGGTGLLASCLLLALAGRAAAQEHVHAASPADTDPLLRVVLEGPHLVLAHDGFIVLTEPQVDVLRQARKALCAAEVAYVAQKKSARAELASALEAAADTGALRSVLDRLARLEVEWTLALVRARTHTVAALDSAQRQQLAWLGAHWTREARALIPAATQTGHRGHPGMQLPIRVPGMVVAETALAPFCEALHGPAVHISIPPPR